VVRAELYPLSLFRGGGNEDPRRISESGGDTARVGRPVASRVTRLLKEPFVTYEFTALRALSLCLRRARESLDDTIYQIMWGAHIPGLPVMDIELSVERGKRETLGGLLGMDGNVREPLKRLKEISRRLFTTRRCQKFRQNSSAAKKTAVLETAFAEFEQRFADDY
jgi:hypothetical protein